jgi:4-deoxy-L-threo-5-hexosulose-uronate ketol-isomerase
MSIKYELRYSNHPQDFKNYTTQKIRDEFLVSNIMVKDEIQLVYSFNDRLIVGGAVPGKKNLNLETIDPLKSGNFLDRRELGIINVGGKGIVKTDDQNMS